ncbi:MULTISPECIES: sigma-70 family RNA polymerase sigma factor [Pontibacillus]|uniref:Sigma-70 family RNA polymerase sigma factor n=1 Tax=Pontibacillus chungwhensis TaxID=265426 RepID=A0ABY8UXU1_9BACI|nr:sigma-70 family RNA polymerase sigma factor [Pontibacillus chungwhensis]MCD5324116.1 sigma-70 family RNA polymerase sigma factor [Pontibacillus sp. HN14]WIF97827.1 sigma-70 family RNA polymerase sigma factor [Pontibacillus chungwhensis]
MTDVKEDFSELVEQFTPMIHHIIHKLRIRDPHKDFYQEGLLALWEAGENYQEEKGKLSSYIYFIVRNRLISKMRKENRIAEKDEVVTLLLEEESVYYDSSFAVDPYLYQGIVGTLTGNQRKWFDGFVLRELTIKEIAEREGTTQQAVKNWGRLAREKLRQHPRILEYIGK